MAGNKHIKRYKALADLQQALSEGKVTSPGIIALDDESVHYDNNLKSIYPQYVINKGDFDWESFKIYNVKPEENDEPVYIETEFSLDKEFEYIYLDGGNISLNITSNKLWECEYDSRYISISPNSANGNKSINITVYSDSVQHELNIDFYVENKKVATFPIYQYAYEDMPLTFEALNDGYIGYRCTSSYVYEDIIQYSINGKSWQTSNSIQNGIYIDVKSGDRVFIKGNSKNLKNQSSYTFFKSSTTYNIFGNIGSLFGNDWVYYNNYMYSNCCYKLFCNDTSVYNIRHLSLPATQASEYCYDHMFSNCTSLIEAPYRLPATTLAESCYFSMFSGCISLTTAPELPATTISVSCYSNMFRGCTSLITAPDLPATTLTESCYYSMFMECASLTLAPSILPATTLANGCYSSMFSSCTSLITAPALPAMTLTNQCYDHMFSGCTSLTNSPELPAPILVNSCYEYMFSGCTNLNYIKCLAINITPGYSCLNGWVNCVAASGTFECLSGNENIFSRGTSGIPANWDLIGNYDETYLIFKVKSSGTITLTTWAGNDAKGYIEYSKNFGQTWNSLTTVGISYGTPAEINVNTNDIIYIKGNRSAYYINGTYNSFGGTATVEIYGNINSLLGNNSMGVYAFYKLFNGYINMNISSVKKLIFPQKVLTSHCYSGIFGECGNLTNLPEIQATTLAKSCYYGMFYSCTSLINALTLPITTLAESCYYDMFRGCTSLVNAPELPATTLVDNEDEYGCYGNMFRGCTSLVNAPELPATTLGSYCYQNMFRECTSLVNAPELPATELKYGCFDGMFYGCTSLINSPQLLSKILVNRCYRNMFTNCSNLNSIKCYAIDISATDCLKNWVDNVAISGTFYKNVEAYTIWNNNNIPNGWIIQNDNVTMPLTIEIISVTSNNDAIKWITDNNINITRTIEYSYGDGTWTSITSGYSGLASTSIRYLNPGTIIQFRGNNSSYSNSASDIYGKFSISENIKFKLKGNILSLINKDNFYNVKLTSYYTFTKLFSGCLGLKYADELILPSTTLTNSCYREMFSWCQYLLTPPALPATTLATGCYRQMFNACYSLTTAPDLPATTLAESCYYSMFMGCASLTLAPSILPATTLANGCYEMMFYSCASLTTAPILPATTLANWCYSEMFYNCKLLSSAPDLPATTLANSCYERMFKSCTNLNYIKCLATNISASNCTADWVNGVASSGTFIKDSSMNDWTIGDNGVPSGWTIQDAA